MKFLRWELILRLQRRKAVATLGRRFLVPAIVQRTLARDNDRVKRHVHPVPYQDNPRPHPQQPILLDVHPRAPNCIVYVTAKHRPDQLGHQLAMRLRAAYAHLRRRSNVAFSSFGMTADQYVVLTALAQEGAATQQQTRRGAPQAATMSGV